MSSEGVQQIGYSSGARIPRQPRIVKPQAADSGGRAPGTTSGAGEVIQDYLQTGLPTGAMGALRDKSFVDAWTGSAERWMTRSWTGRLIDHALDRSGLTEESRRIIADRTKTLGSSATQVASNSVSYRQMFNIGKTKALLDAEELINPMAFDYHTVAVKDLNLKNYISTVRENYKNVFKPSDYNGGMRASEYVLKHPLKYMKNTVINNNVKSIAQTLRDGRNPGAGVMSVLGLGILGYDILSTTYDAYKDAKAQEDDTMGSRLNTVGKTAKTFALKTAKSAVVWEIGSVGFTVGASLFCIGSGVGLAGVIIPLAGGVATGALVATMAKKGIDATLAYLGLEDKKSPALAIPKNLA